MQIFSFVGEGGVDCVGVGGGGWGEGVTARVMRYSICKYTYKKRYGSFTYIRVFRITAASEGESLFQNTPMLITTLIP